MSKASDVASRSSVDRCDASKGINHANEAPRTMCNPAFSASTTRIVPPNAQQVTPDQPVLRSLTIEQPNPERGSPKSVAMDIKAEGTADTRALNGQAGGISKYGRSSSESKDWRTQFYMLIHLPNGDIKMYICKNDTASKVNILSRQVVKSLGMEMEPYNGPPVAPMSALIQPIGKITLDWHVLDRTKTYTTEFIVLDDKATSGFDALLSEDTVGEIGFYFINNAVWFCESSEPQTSS